MSTPPPQIPTSPAGSGLAFRAMSPRYDTIGTTYTATRRADPRVEAQIRAALGDARRVLNVGGGTGSYESAGPVVAAVDPSPVMLAQRPPGAAPAARGVAEHLPFRDGAFDAALAHLHDPPLVGLARRASPRCAASPAAW